MRALKSASAEYTIPKSGNLDLQPKGDKIYIMWFLSYYLIFNFEAELEVVILKDLPTLQK
jgi:hypothetical protein